MLGICEYLISIPLQCTPDRIDGGPVVIGTSVRHCLTLVNQYSCSLRYQLAVEQVILESEDGGQMVHLTQQPHGIINTLVKL